MALSGVFAAEAQASELIAHVSKRSVAQKASIKVNKKGIALLTFVANRRVNHLLAKGAINARHPKQSLRASGKQVEFKLDYKGGWGFFRKANYWRKGFGRNVCGAYEGPELPWLIKACTMPDGSHWAIQSWQRRLLAYGRKGKPQNRVWEIRLSHWNTEPAVLNIQLDWQSWGDRHYDHLWGKLTYLSKPVYGFGHKLSGAPTDAWGRNIYLETHNSAYGPGWKHENAFLTHKPRGGFCYVVAKHGSRPAGMGDMYRATVIGPGVTPDVMWQDDSPGEFDSEADEIANQYQEIDLAGDSRCEIR